MSFKNEKMKEFEPFSNLSGIKWAHAVNTRQLLYEALQNATVEMIEADVMYDKFFEESNTMFPVMGHPPSTFYDIELPEYLKYTVENNKAGKGLKLDFKSIEAFESSLDALHEYIPQLTFPIWLNADILCGPRAKTVQPVDAKRFLNNCAMFPTAVISIGWTTDWDDQDRNDSYTWSHVEEMIEMVMHETNMKYTQQKITFPVRAGPASLTIEPFEELLSVVGQKHPCTFTVWSAPSDFVQVHYLEDFVRHFGLDRVYVDVPEPLKLQLELNETLVYPMDKAAVVPSNGGKKSASKPSLMRLTLVLAGMTMAGILMKRQGYFRNIEKTVLKVFNY